jgi:NADPH:quinone reductase-like Zn-dependent oxidoreductase
MWCCTGAPCPHLHAVLDMVGKSTFQACRRILLTGGIYVSSDLGPFAQNLALPFAIRVGRRPRRRVVFPLPIETPEILEHLRSRLESGAFRPIIDRTYPLKDIVEAHRYVESDQKVGKVVIDVRTD